MANSRVQIHLAATGTPSGNLGNAAIMLNDFPIANDVGALKFEADSKDGVRLTIELAHADVDFEGEAAVKLGSLTQRALISLGWNPPEPDLPPPSWCNCEKFSSKNPTCPQHGEGVRCKVRQIVAGYARRCELREHGTEIWHRDGRVEWTPGDKGPFVVVRP